MFDQGAMLLSTGKWKQVRIQRTYNLCLQIIFRALSPQNIWRCKRARLSRGDVHYPPYARQLNAFASMLPHCTVHMLWTISLHFFRVKLNGCRLSLWRTSPPPSLQQAFCGMPPNEKQNSEETASITSMLEILGLSLVLNIVPSKEKERGKKSRKKRRIEPTTHLPHNLYPSPPKGADRPTTSNSCELLPTGATCDL